jgi:uncharacterized membrane protein
MSVAAMTLGSLVVGPLQFDRPVWLLLIPILGAACWWLSRGGLSGLGRAAKWAALGVRVLGICLLAGALAQPQLRRVAEAVGVAVVVDVSRSVPSGAQERIDRFVADAQESRREGDLLGVVTAARAAFVQASPGRMVRGVERRFVGDRDGTNLADAVNLAIASLPSDAAGRVVLISDGNETDGSLLRAAQQARALNIPVDVLSIEFDIAAEVIVEELQAPSGVRVGETVSLRAVLTTTGPVTGRLTVMENGEVLDMDPDPAETGYLISLDPGRHVMGVPVTPRRPGAQQYSAVFEPLAAVGPGEGEPGSAGRPVGPGRGDTMLENNRASAITFVTSEGTVLIVANAVEEATALQDALHSAEIRTELIGPGELPATLPELTGYDAIVMLNQSAYASSADQQEQLRRYVHDTGGGLVMVGGPDSFGAGGWIGSPLADALPIRLDPPQKRQLPMGALALVIDASGSMGMPVTATGSTQQQVANEAAVLGISTLSRMDEATVVAFDGSTSVVVPLTRLTDPSAVARRIRSIRSGGGTNMFPAMEEAGQQLSGTNAGVRHMIILSDGQTAGDPSSGTRIASNLQARGITVSTISVGDGANDRLMSDIALRGGGRWYKVSNDQAKDLLPQIFVREAQTVRRALIWEGEAFSPARTGAPTETMRGISGVPPITGYVVAAEREGLSLVTLRGKEEDPIGAQWQHGLGRVVTFTSDASTRWAGAWVAWSGYNQFWEQHVRWAMRPNDDASLRVVTENRGDQTVVIVEAFGPEGDRLNFARFDARIAGPDGTGEAVAIRQVGPGRYEGVFDSSNAGDYVVSMRYRALGAVAEAGGATQVLEGSVQAAVTRPYADEFRALKTNTPLMHQVASITGGRVLSSDPTLAALWSRDGLAMPVSLTPVWLAFLVAGVVVFVADVGVRRVRIEPRAIAAWARRSVSREGARTTGATEAMRSVKGRRVGAPVASGTASAGGPAMAVEPPPRERASRRFEADADRAAAAGPVALSGEAETESPLKKKDRPKAIEPEARDSLSALRAARKRAQDDMQDR